MSEEIAYCVTREQLVMAFSEWKLRYDEDPESFVEMNDDYGEACADYFIGLVSG